MNKTKNSPLVKCFDYDNESYKLTILLETNVLHVLVENIDLSEFYWENKFEIEEMMKMEKNWNIYEENEIPLIIADCLSAKNYIISLENEVMRFYFWNKLVYGVKEKTLRYTLDLNKIKIEKETIFNSIIENIKNNNRSNSELKEIFNDYKKKIEEIHSENKSNLIDLKQSVQKNEENIKNLNVKLVDHIDKTNNYFDHIMNKFDDTVSKLENMSSKLTKNNLFNVNTYSFNYKNTINLLHFTNFDCYSPSKESLIQSAKYAGLNLNINENRGLELNYNLLAGIDTVLVSTSSKVNKEKLGNLLSDFIDKGGNVIIVLLANSLNNSIPTGKFQEITPLIPKDTDYKFQTYNILIPNHPLFEGNPRISEGGNKIRSILEVNPNGNIELVAKWSDGVPMVAIRTDLNGLITSIGFNCGNVGSPDGNRLVINAIKLSK